MITKKIFYTAKRALIQLQTCDSNGNNSSGFKPLYLTRSDLTTEEVAALDALLEKIIDRQNTEEVETPEEAEL